MAEKKLNFEQSIGRLQEIVSALEKGDAPLADSLKLFEEGTEAGVSLLRYAGQGASRRWSSCVKSADGTPQEVPFAAEEDA